MNGPRSSRYTALIIINLKTKQNRSKGIFSSHLKLCSLIAVAFQEELTGAYTNTCSGQQEAARVELLRQVDVTTAAVVSRYKNRESFMLRSMGLGGGRGFDRNFNAGAADGAAAARLEQWKANERKRRDGRMEVENSPGGRRGQPNVNWDHGSESDDESFDYDDVSQ